MGQVWDKMYLMRHAGGSWQENDVIQVDLDCDAHTLRMTNLRSGDIASFDDLPDEELFPFFYLSQIGATMTLV